MRALVGVPLLLVLSLLVLAPSPVWAASGTQVAHDTYGYPYPNAPDCDEGATLNGCVADNRGFYQGQCTSWVAYRLSQQNGINFTNWYGQPSGQRWGDATGWGAAAGRAGIAVNMTPGLGSVVWYASGHVGYVEQINSDGSVVMSEMNRDMHNSFGLVTIRPGNRWPSGFIHVKDLSGPSPKPAAMNIVKGGGFESGGWSVMGTTNFTTYSAGQVVAEERPRSGTRYAATNTSTDGGGFFQDVPVSIGAGDTFCGSAFVRSQAGGTVSGNFTIWLIGGTSESGSDSFANLGTLDSWTPVNTCVTATEAHSAVRVQFYVARNGGTLEVDDVSANRSLARGGGFEAAGWSIMPGSNFVSYGPNQVAQGEVPRSGSKYGATNASADGGGIFQDIPTSIAPGDTYCASAFVRSQAGGTAHGALSLWLIGGTSENGVDSYGELGTFDNWAPVSTCVTATQAHSAIRVQFYPGVNGGTTEIDDVNVARSLVQGGGFETGGWSIMPGTNFTTYSANQIAQGEVPRSGSKYGATNTSADGGGIYQDVARSIEPGETYCASAFVRSQAGGSTAGAFALWLIGGTSENGVDSYANLSTKDNWTPVSTCVTATQPHSGIRVQFYPAKNGGTTEIDDVAVGNMAVLPLQRLLNRSRPTVAGKAATGSTLTAGPGSWFPAARAYSYQWLRGGVAIPGATASTHRLVSADYGKRISVRVRASRWGYLAAATSSVQTIAVGDGSAPSVRVAGTPVFRLGSSVPVSWSGSDVGSGVASYDVRWRRASYSAGFGAWQYPATWQKQARTSVTHNGLVRGYTYCYSVRARDRAGNVSGWAAGPCTSVALDDRSLSGSGWSAGTGAAFFASTYKSTTVLNRVLSRSGAQVSRVAVVARRCPSCGTVGVYVGSTLVGKVNLYAATKSERQVIVLPKFAYRTGTVSLRVLSSGKQVLVDGIGISRA